MKQLQKFIILTLLALLITGCGKTIKEKSKPLLNEITLREITIKAKAIKGQKVMSCTKNIIYKVVNTNYY